MCSENEVNADEYRDGGDNDAGFGMVESDHYILIENCLFGCLFRYQLQWGFGGDYPRLFVIIPVAISFHSSF